MCGPKCVLTLPHPDKVQCLQWHPYDPQLLATGAYDGRVRLFNCVASQNKTREWKLDGEIERLLWNHLKPDHLLASTDGHTVHCLDRHADSAVFQIHAHTDAICDLSLSCYMPGLLVTASTDDTIKFWDIQDDKPVFLLSRSMHMGAVLCARFCVDSPYALAVGGTRNGFQTLDIRGLVPVAQRFRGRDMIMPLVPDSTNGKEVVTEDRGVVKESDTESETVESIGVAGSPEEEEMEVGASRVIEEKKVKGKTKHKGKGRHKGKRRMH
jgi:periodic tryptophan protein 1